MNCTARTGRKLIRDRVPVDDGGREGARAFGNEYSGLLLDKLVEEAEEARGAFVEGTPERMAEELADVLEVLQAAAVHLSGGWGHVLHLQALKHARRGGFTLGRTYHYPEL
jgi:predicted house-cleaning noncanonical NTP pyrophosphatase (MazG superfamily)